jgi:hypothetical protein
VTPRDWAGRDGIGRNRRAWIALLASIAGSAALTGFAAWAIWILWRGGWPAATAEQRIALLGEALLLALAGSLVVLVSLGLAINRREIRVSRDGVELSGGDDPDPPNGVRS